MLTLACTINFQYTFPYPNIFSFFSFEIPNDPGLTIQHNGLTMHICV